MNKIRVVWDDFSEPISDAGLESFVKDEINSFRICSSRYEYSVQYKSSKSKNSPTFVGIVGQSPKWAIDIQPYSYIHTVYVCNELAIEQFRCAVVDGLISHEELEFEFDGEVILVDKHVQLKSYPIGFCDTYEKLLMKLVGWK